MVAKTFVRGPGFSHNVADGAPTGPLPDGWAYVAEDVEPEDLIPAWRQPTGSVDAYAKGTEVLHAGKRWASLVAANVWEPGVSSWREIPIAGESPAWVQPTGAHDAYPLGAVVSHLEHLWRSTRDANVWEPNTQDAGWLAIIQVVPSATWVNTGTTVAQLVGAGVYRISANYPGLVAGQAIKLGTAETVFTGYWSGLTNYLLISPHVSAAVGSTVWKWA